MLQPLEDLTSRRRHQACSDTGSVKEILSAVKAHDKRINTQICSYVVNFSHVAYPET